VLGRGRDDAGDGQPAEIAPGPDRHAEAHAREHSYQAVQAALTALEGVADSLDFSLLQPKGWLARATEIVGAVVGESARWGDVRRPALPYTRNVEWTNELNRLLTEYFPVRTQIFIDQLKTAGLYPKLDPPTFTQPGGNVAPGFQLALDAPAGTVYYTLDGTDPRLPGGALAPGAIAYVPTTPLVTTASTVRVFVPLDNALGTNWTGGVPGFNDASWAARTNATGFDASATPALAPVLLTNATADFSQAGQLVTSLTDGSLISGGWGIFQPDFVNKGRSAIAVCETLTNLGYADGTRLVVTLRFSAGGQNWPIESTCLTRSRSTSRS